MMDISRVRAITLDLDDTLWPIWPAIERAEIRMQEWLAPRAPRASALFSSVQTRLELRKEAQLATAHQAHDLSAIRLEMIRRGLARVGEETTLAPAALTVFMDARMQVELYADVLPALAALAGRYRIVAVSNGNADVHRIGIGQYFAASLSAGDVGVAKPDPRIFHAAASALDVPPHQVLHVGDDAHLDVLGALQVGMQTAWVNRTEAVWTLEQQPHATVTDMAGLCRLLLG